MLMQSIYKYIHGQAFLVLYVKLSFLYNGFYLDHIEDICSLVGRRLMRPIERDVCVCVCMCVRACVRATTPGQGLQYLLVIQQFKTLPSAPATFTTSYQRRYDVV